MAVLAILIPLGPAGLLIGVRRLPLGCWSFHRGSQAAPLLVFSPGFAGCPSWLSNVSVGCQIPGCVAARDPLYHQSTAKKDARMAAVLNIWRTGGGLDGGVGAVWSDILHTRGYQLFIPSYLEWLKHT